MIITPYYGIRPQVNFTSNLSKIKELGYKFHKNVNLISPKGEKINCKAFIKDELNTAKDNLSILITDDRNIALGELHARREYNNPNIVLTSIRNYTEKYNILSGFMDPFLPARSFEKDGKYKLVGTNAYKVLINYLKENYKDVVALRINARTSGSWDFHAKLGFTSIPGAKEPAKIGDYDCYSLTNYMDYEL